MAIQNREMGASQRREPFQFTTGALATGTTTVLTVVPYYCSLDVAQTCANGVSSTCTGMLYLSRFVVGAGATTFPLGSTFAVATFGTSGLQNAAVGLSLPQIGATTTTLLPGDQIIYWATGAGAIASLSGVLALRPLGDIISMLGIIG